MTGMAGMAGMMGVHKEGGGKILADERTDKSIEGSTRGPCRPILIFKKTLTISSFHNLTIAQA